MTRPRHTPYTVRGIKRVACWRCGALPGYSNWQVCADGNAYRALCVGCDISLNALVMHWMNVPEWRAKVHAYIALVRGP